MVWAALSRNGVGPIFRIPGILNGDGYVGILQNQLLPYCRKTFGRAFERRLVFQQYNDPKHTCAKAKNWFLVHKVKQMTWPSQSPDMNPIENLWNDVKKVVREKKPANLNELERVIVEAWQNIPAERCAKLVDSMHARCRAVIESKGCATKY